VAHRKFAQKGSVQVISEPITFDVGDEENIACRDHVNGKLLIELVGKVESPNVGVQTDGILAIFDVAVRVDDGEDPEHFSGKKYDRFRPYEHHTQSELDGIDEENDEIREKNEAIRERNDAKLAKAREDGVTVEDDSLEEFENMVVPGIDPTSSWGRLQSTLNDPNTVIEVEELAEIVGWLVEQYTGRPTRNAGGSRGGFGNTNRGSRRARRSPGRTGGQQTPAGSST
jgi:hypothetical protein